MSNLPKIIYRSDTTACTYQMMQRNGSFVIQVIQFDAVKEESHDYIYLKVWRANIDRFFDVITHHINTGKWEG